MAQDGTVDSRVWLKKTLATAAALAAVCGVVAAMRWGVRLIVFSSGLGGGGSSAAPAAEPSYCPAPREYALARLVPEDLRRNAGGLFVRSDETILQMPCEQAVEVSRAEAEAAGWSPFGLPLAMEAAETTASSTLYVRPDRVLVSRTFTSRSDGTTRREDLVMPFGDLAGASHDLTMEEIIALRGDRIGPRLPDVLRDVLPGRAFYTQFTPHADGASFIVVTLSPHGSGMVRREVVQKLRARGWTRDEQNAPDVWRRGNLSAIYDVCECGDGMMGTLTSVRFADAEVLNKRKENEE